MREFHAFVVDPAVEALVNHVPLAVFLRQPPPFAAVLACVRQRIYEGDEYAPDFPVCPLVYFHASNMTAFHSGNTPSPTFSPILHSPNF